MFVYEANTSSFNNRNLQTSLTENGQHQVIRSRHEFISNMNIESQWRNNGAHPGEPFTLENYRLQDNQLE